MAPTANITLNSLNLDVLEQSVKLMLLGAGHQDSRAGNATTSTISVPKVKGLRYDKEQQYVIVDLDSQLVAGQQYLLSLDYSGFLSEDLAGFYRISFKSENSTEPT